MSSQTRGPEAPTIELQEAKAEFDRGTALFVDVRKPDDYERSHIPGAATMPLKELFLRSEELPRDRLLIFY